jgi:inosose dehydratase
VPEEECQKWVDYAGERGIEIVIHPHVGKGGRGTGGVETREDLLCYLDARPGVFACPDTGHLMLCGSDPVQTIRDLGERCRYVHLKDIDLELAAMPEMKGKCFCDLGTGGLDLLGVMRALEDIDFDGWVMVERDQRVEDYVQSARNMRDVLRRLSF